MTALPHLHPSDEANWQGLEKVWSTSVHQYPPKKVRAVSGWWVFAIGAALVLIAIRSGL